MSSSLGVPGKGPNSFVAEHLATFVIGSGNSMPVEDGLKRLQEIEKSGGVWTLKVRIQIVPPNLIILDESTGRVIEKFSMRSLKDVQSVNASGAYNNLIVFTVLDSHITELHIFRCVGRNASDFVSTVEFGKSGRISPGGYSLHSAGPQMSVPDSLDCIPRLNPSEVALGKKMLRESLRFPSFPTPDFPSQITDPTDRKVKLLDCLFSDIETFVNQLQRAVEAFNNLKKRRTIRENGNGDGLLSMRCKLPPGKDFTDILQKFKLSFILIEKMKQKISKPNAPELIHFLFKPLSFVVKVVAGGNFEKMDLVSSVDNPLLTMEVRYMFENCLDTAENDLWRKLGKAWILTKDEWHESLPMYRPIFIDGWSPPLEWMREIFSETTSILKPVSNPKANRTQEEFKKELQAKNAKMAIVKEDRAAAHVRELTVTAGELLEVLDDSRNWWKTKNCRDEIGFVTKKILQTP